MNQITFEQADTDKVEIGQIRKSHEETVLIIDAENGDGYNCEMIFNAIHVTGPHMFETVFNTAQDDAAIKINFPYVVDVQEIKIITKEEIK